MHPTVVPGPPSWRCCGILHPIMLLPWHPASHHAVAMASCIPPWCCHSVLHPTSTATWDQHCDQTRSPVSPPCAPGNPSFVRWHPGALAGAGTSLLVPGTGGQKGVSLKLKHFIPIRGLGTHRHGQSKTTQETQTSHCSHRAGGVGRGGLIKPPLSLAHVPWQPARPFLT